MLPKQYYTGGIGGVGADKPHRKTGWFGINQGKIYQDNPGVIVYDDPSRNKTQTVEEEANKNTGANRGAVGSLGTSSSVGTAGSAQAGLVGSVNTEVQNDDQLLPYKKL
jgi:hypothetical protein